VTSAAGPYPLFYLRGVGNFNGNSLSDSAIAFNLDGVYIARPSSTGGTFYDLSRVEVLKGPQGILYGRNATGGAINVVTNPPALGKLGGYADIDIGNYALHRVDGALNLPLGSKVALRFAGQTLDHGGYLSDGTDDAKDRAGRVELLARPDDALSILTTADYYHQGGKGDGATLLSSSFSGFADGNPRIGNTDPRIGAIYSQTLYFPAGNFLGPLLQKALLVPTPASLGQNNDFWGASTTVDWRTDAGTLTVVPAYRHGSLDYTSTQPGFLISQAEQDQQTSVEARFAAPDEARFSYLIGAYYLDERIAAGPVLYDQQYNGSSEQLRTGTLSYAAFSHLRYSLTHTFRLTGGVRYTSDGKDFNGRYQSSAVLCPSALAPPPAMPRLCFGGVGQITIPTMPIQDSMDRRWQKVTWEGGAEWDVTPYSMAYAQVESGFKSGGFYFTHDDPTFKPEQITAYTLGVKNRLWENRMQLNAEAFYWRYSDQQVSHISLDSTGTVVFATQNVGKATMKGLEVDGQFLPFDHTLLGADVQYLDAVYDSFTYTVPDFGSPPTADCAYTPSGTVYALDCGGKTPPEAPRWTLDLSAQQTFPLSGGADILANASTHFQTMTLTGQEFLAQEMQPSYWNTDLSLGYESSDGRWRVTLYVDNVANATVLQGTFPHPLVGGELISASLQPPRTYGGRVRVDF
jgi:iron complex outermembrane receptor protein